MSVPGWITAVVGVAAVLFVLIAGAGLALVVLLISEERHGGDRGDGCRRRPDCNGMRPRSAEPAGGRFSHQQER